MAHAFHPSTRVWLGLTVQGDLGPLTLYTSKRGKTVWFLRAPPLRPPSDLQENFRDFFRTAAASWRQTAPANRTNWQLAANHCSLGISGYNLWVWYSYTRDEPALKTIERQSGIDLYRPS